MKRHYQMQSRGDAVDAQLRQVLPQRGDQRIAAASVDQVVAACVSRAAR
jgi:hypothetical protein